MRHLVASTLAAAALAVAASAGCGPGGTSGSTGSGGAGGTAAPLTTDELMDPQSCAKCHPDHVKEWSGSMHAYAADDPVFLAMNARGQRETSGMLGTFCVNCHAPMAVATKATKDGTDLAKLPAKLRGVTCYFCHSVDAVMGTHDNPLTLATDGVMRGGIADPVPTGAHHAGYASLLDRTKAESASLCGSCHDIVTPLGAHLERTYAEWQGTLFSHGDTLLTCGQCHMDGRQGLAAQAPGVKLRKVHAHTFPGVDVALSDYPEMQAQKDAVQASLDTTLQAELCVKNAGNPGAVIQVVLDNVGAGHQWPSGVVHDRRAWVEVIAYANNQPIYQSGVVPDGDSVVKLNDPDLWLVRECLFDQQDKKVDMFWQAASLDSNQLPGPTTNKPTDPAFYLTHVVRDYPRPTSMPSSLATPPDRVTLRVRLAPIGLDVLDDLVASKDLDPAVKSKVPVFTLAGTVVEWTAAAATIKYADQGLPVACVSAGLATGANQATPAPEKTKCSP
jgi:Cytochrome c554 and c-prime